MRARNERAWRRVPIQPRAALVIVLIWVASVALPLAQLGTAGSQAPKCTVNGTVTAGNVRLPGVAITLTTPEGGTPLTTSTQLDGRYSLEVPGPGRYQVRGELTTFAPVTTDLVVGPACQATLDLTMTLASRTAGAAPVEARPIPAQRVPAAGQFQRLAPVADATGAKLQQQGLTGAATETTDTVVAHLSLPPGFSPENLSESIAAFGSTGQTNNALLFGGFREGMGLGMMGSADLFGGTGTEGQAGMGLPGTGFPGAGMPGQGLGGRGEMAGGQGGGRGGAGGGPGGGRGGMGGPGGGMGGPGGRGEGGPGGLSGRLALGAQAQNNRPRGQFAYTLGGSPLDASPYSLTSQPAPKPNYLQQRFAGSIGGPLKIPGLFDAGPRTSFFLNYTGNHSSNFYSAYSTVPTAALRAGDLSLVPTPVIDPLTGQPFPGNQIPADRINPAALALLNFIPLPNQAADRKNFYYSTTNGTSSDDINFRFIRSFGTATRRQGRPGQGGGGGGGRGGGRGGGGSVNLNIGIHYTRSETTQSNPFPSITGKSHRTGWDVPVNVSFSRWGIQHTLNFDFNRSDSQTLNAYAYVQNVAGNAGILGVSTVPFDWGVPSISFSTFSGLKDITPSLNKNQTLAFSDSMLKMKGRHSIRFGGDFRDVRIDSRTDATANGAYVFTGLYSGTGGGKASGLDFADFLLGYAQQASVQYGPGLGQLRTRSWNVYVQDDWRVRTNFTLNAGLRYEYQSPYWAANNHLVNLDVAPDFSAAVPVEAGQAGPYTGLFPNTLVNPDRNNLSPRIGIAWRPLAKTIVRSGYGINYASVPYMSAAQRMLSQPPYAVTNTLIAATDSPLLLTNAFANPVPNTTTNNYGIDRYYRLGYVQIWNVDVQRDLTRTLSVGAAYIGTKGSQLDIQRAPNRGPDGLLIPNVQAFIWESSGGRSDMNAVSVRVSRRLAQGISGGATYTYSKSMDNASTIGGGAVVVAQNDQNLGAEWGLSSFDQRHRFTGTFTFELPFGPDRRWLKGGGVAGELLGGWILNGTVQAASGTPFTARVTGNVGDVSRGTNGTLRADYGGEPISLADPTILQFFNTSAFTIPASGTFGNAARNTIPGPGNVTLNMGLMKTFKVPGTRGLSLRIQATNVLNTPNWATIDTVVNSPTFGQVTGVRPMRSVQIIARVMF